MTSRVFFGDSITAGQYVNEDQRWTSFFPGTVLAVSGDTTRLALERFGQVQALRPDELVIQFGLNDCNRWESDWGLPRVSEAAFEANLHEMVNRANHFGVDRTILLTSHPTLRSAEYEADRRKYNHIVKRVAYAEFPVDLLDIEPEFPADCLTDLLLLDGLHLSPLGHGRYYELLAPMLA